MTSVHTCRQVFQVVHVPVCVCVPIQVCQYVAYLWSCAVTSVRSAYLSAGVPGGCG